jgi:polyisoprenoid-binding protein YceI
MRKFLVATLVASAALTAAVNADTYKVDPAHSSVAFAVTHNSAATVYGIFALPNGKLELKDGGSATIVVKTDTINTGIAKRDQHLKSNDYFAAEQFPTIKFESEKVEKTDTGFKLTGNLTLHGVTKPLVVDLVATGTGKGMDGGEVAGFSATFTIKRSDFGMTAGAPAVSDEVKLMVSLEAAKQ